MTRAGPRRRPAPPFGPSAPNLPVLGLLAALAALALPAVPAGAQAVDCPALRAEIDGVGRPGDPGRYAVALRQQQGDIARTRAYADQSGCGDGLFDDPDSPECRALARRLGTLEDGLRRLQDQAARAADGGAEDRRRALLESYNAECGIARTEADAPQSVLPVDPDVPPASDTPDAPAPATSARSPVVLCVRHCDGAYYPLATDVRQDRLADMDRICQAQCPAATASAYAGRDADDVADAQSTEGTRYTDLAAAFKFRKGPTGSCACRAPNQSWADALAGAEAMLEPHKGDVTVTPALAESMSRPATPPAATPARTLPAKTMPAKTTLDKTTPDRATPAPRKAARRPAAPDAIPVPDAPQPPDAAQDLTREFRRSGPTL